MTIALTFDDGPNTTITPQVLDLLEQYHIPASFFLIAQNINDSSVRMVKRAVKLGCEINNHSVTHRPMSRMSAEEVREEILPCTEAIKKITGKAPCFFRPPFIDVSPELHERVELPFICGKNCLDWEPSVSAERRIDMLLDHVEDGDLILLHDMPGNVNTVEALRVLIPEWLKRGISFATCTGLFEEKGIQPVRGRLYSNVMQTGYRLD